MERASLPDSMMEMIMESTIKVSVLTPIYNVERYLPQCLESLVSQTLPEMELICINDGSTDASLRILKEFAEKDPRIIIIDKPNGGYGQSMNMGLARATGEYIGIVESDDFADPNMFKRLYEVASAHDCDIVRSNRYDLTEAGSRFNEILRGLPYNTVFAPADMQEIFKPAPCIWTSIYRRQFLNDNGICFLETPGASFQDTGFVYKSLISARRMMLVRDAFLHYRMDNAGSSVKSAAKVFCICDEFESIDAFLEQRPDDEPVFRATMQALRYQTYSWNYNRLNWKARKEFLPRFAAEFKSMQDKGVLTRGGFSAVEWDRLLKIIKDPDSVFEADVPLISVIVPAYNCERHILDTLNSLNAQSLKRIEVIVVDDGSTDKTAALVDSFAANHRNTIVIHQPNGGVASARNTGLDAAMGKYISFIDGEDTVPVDGLERLYRSAEAEGADMSIGIIHEFNAILDHDFERTVALSRKPLLSRYDLDLIWSFSVNNKLFRRDKIEKLGLRFEEGIVLSEDGLFLMTYVYDSDIIVGVPATVLEYRRDFFWDGFSATHSAGMKYAEDLVYVIEKVIELAEKSFDRDISQATDELTQLKLSVEKILYIREMRRRLVAFLIDLQYRRIWMLDDEAASYVIEQIEANRQYIDDGDWEGVCRWHNDLPLASGLQTQAQIAENPLVTFVVSLSEAMGAENARLTFDSIYHNVMPCFEVIIPKDMLGLVPEYYRSLPNLKAIEFSTGPFEEAALESALGPYIVFMKEPIFHWSETLRILWKDCINSQADFVAAEVLQVDGDRKVLWKSQKTVFTTKRSEGFSKPSYFNQLDKTLNNKLIKTHALRTKGEALTGNSAVDSLMLYENLSFKKDPLTFLITRMSEAEFLGDVTPVQTASVKASYVIDRADFDHGSRYLAPYIQKAARIARAVERRAIPKDTILFFSNRGDLSDNLRMIYDRLEGRKVVLTQPLPHSDAYQRVVARALKRSKLVVLDDTCHLLKDIQLHRDKTKIVQLWHACGAFKKFGLDNLKVPADLERPKHSQYALVSVSSDYVRPIYANAFGIGLDKVKALGVPRTDLLLDPLYHGERLDAVYTAHPELKDKKIVLYCPTFRQEEGFQSVWDPKIDWRELSRNLRDDMVFVVKPHPLERFDLLHGLDFDNILRLDDVATNDLLHASSLVITDYSSIVFDASLLDKPTLFYCPDLPLYQTGFYLDFPDELNGTLVEDSSELLDAIEHELDSPQVSKNDWFKEKFLGACDGHVSDRIADYIKENYL